MRRYWREQQPSRMFRGAELPRLMTGLVMLAVLYMLIVRARDTDTWRWLANDDGKASSVTKEAGRQTPPPTPTLPAATGPTDEDLDQAATAREEFQVVVDGSLGVQREEMEPYDRLVEWVKNQSFARLYHAAEKGLWYTDLYDNPDKHRGELVALNLEIRRAKDVGENRYGVNLHEVWGLTEESRGRLYDVIVVGYPKGMPVGYNVYAKAKFAGYFLKLQGYESGGSRPGQPADKAPLLIGRLQWEPGAVAAPPIDNTKEWTWGLGLLAALGLTWGLWFIYCRWRPRKPVARSMIPDAGSGEVIPIEQWLEQSQFDADNDGLDGGGQAGR